MIHMKQEAVAYCMHFFCDVRCFLREFTGTGRNRLKPPVNFQALQVIPSPDYPPGIKDGNVKSTVDVAFDAIFN